jgi:deoxyribodipyrimidine photo-lyase
MTNTFSRALHIFRRDLRITDNTALNAALAQAAEVLTCFVLDPQQINPHPYQSIHGLQFMRESLEALAESLREKGGQLVILEGDPSVVLPSFVKRERVNAVFFNRDYTPFARNRDRRIKAALEADGCAVQQYGDALLNEPEDVKKGDGGVYSVYTPFVKRAALIPVRAVVPLNESGGKFACPTHSEPNERALERLGGASNQSLFTRGGRAPALAVLSRIQDFKNYHEERDVPAREATTGLSPHHKFGTISVRETYHAVSAAHGSSHTLIRELYWRDFFTYIAFHFPHVFKGCFNRQYDELGWENNEEWFAAWVEGRTGFPIVDAGMRQLKETGFMHNRVRMIVASFLTKDLLIDWHWGERHFARYLADYDPAVNNGGWQWAASTGCDAQPYFRIFNPWLQQKKFDPDALYIKRWIPELNSLPAKAIHAWEESSGTRAGYPSPIVEHATQKSRALKLFDRS